MSETPSRWLGPYLVLYIGPILTLLLVLARFWLVSLRLLGLNCGVSSPLFVCSSLVNFCLLSRFRSFVPLKTEQAYTSPQPPRGDPTQYPGLRPE